MFDQPANSEITCPPTDYVPIGETPSSFMQTKAEVSLSRKFILEFLGTYVMLLFGIGSCAQNKLNSDNGGAFSIHVAWGLGVTFGVYISDGGDLNTAITIANILFNGLSIKKALVLFLAQFIAGFLAAATVFAIYYDSFCAFGNDFMIVPDTAGIFTTFPFTFKDSAGNKKPPLRIGFSVLSEFTATFILYIMVLTFTDEKKKTPGAHLTGFFLGLVVLGIGCSYGQQTGYAMNPARDFPPRLFLLCAGWGSQVFSYGQYYFWVPIIAPILGTLAAGGFYRAVVVEKTNPNHAKIERD